MGEGNETRKTPQIQLALRGVSNDTRAAVERAIPCLAHYPVPHLSRGAPGAITQHQAPEMPWVVPSFPVAAVTKAPQTGRLKNTDFSLFLWRPEASSQDPGPRIKVSWRLAPSGGFRKKPTPCFQVPVAATLQSLPPCSRHLLCVSNLPLPLSFLF